MRILLIFLLTGAHLVTPDDDNPEMDGESSRKVLGSSVVTSVSVVMDTGNGTKAIFADAAGKPVSKPLTASDLASPIDLLNPDRYEFYTFDDSGDLVKRLMTLDEIQGIIATGDGDGFNIDSFTSQGFLPEKRVNDVVNNVQNVLKEEMELHKNSSDNKPIFDTPDVSDSWSMILPAVFGNSGEDIKPEKPITHVTPDTIMIEPNVEILNHSPPPQVQSQISDTTTIKVPNAETNRPIVLTTTPQISTTQKIMTLQSGVVTQKPTLSTTESSKNESTTMINVEIIPNSNSTTGKVPTTDFVEIKPILSDLELSKENIPQGSTPKTISTTSKLITRRTTAESPSTSTKQPIVIQITSSRIPVSASSSSQIPLLSSTVSESTTTTTTNKIETHPTTTEVPLITQTSLSLSTIASTSIEETTTSETTKILELSTKNPEYSLPTFLQILHDQPLDSQVSDSTITTQKILTNTNKMESATQVPETTSTIGGLTTFFIINDNKYKPVTSTDSETLTNKIINPLATTQILPQLNEDKTENFPSTSTEKQTTPFISTIRNGEFEDLTTLNTETVTRKSNPTTISDGNTEKLAAAEILDQLLTSTNIYEINSELSVKTDQLEDRTTSYRPESTTTEDKITTESVAESTTDQNLIASIEQLISQAVGNVEESSQSDKDIIKIQEMLMKSNKTVPQMQVESATMASNLINSANSDSTTIINTPTTTELNILEDIVSENSNNLSEAVSSLLSQVYSSSNDALTTTLSSVADDNSTGTTTENYQQSTTIISTTTDIDNLVTEYEPHIINITIIRNENLKNQSKPAKADLSLEMDYELNKNQTLEVIPTEPSKLIEPTITDLNNIELDTATIKLNLIQKEAQAIIDTTTEVISDSSTILDETTRLVTSTSPTLDSTFIPPTTTEITKKDPKPSIVITVNESSKNESTIVAKPESTWTLVPTVAPHSDDQTQNVNTKPIAPLSTMLEPPKPIDLVPKPLQGFGLEESTARLDTDVYQFVQLCNELAFGFWKTVTTGISTARSVVVSPFSATSLLAMVFLGARGATSGEMNEILRLDDMVTFNPHLIFKNVSESIETTPESGVAISAIIRELYSDRSKGKLLSFYKERAKQFYDGHVEEVGFREINDIIRRRTNLLVKKHTSGKISEFLKDSSLTAKPPLAGISASIFYTDCSQASVEGRDGELHFVVLPSIRQRRLIPIPAAVWRSGFLAGYEPSLDATAVALGNKDQVITTIFVIPGQQGIAAPGDGLARLEKRIVESSFKKGAWSRLLRSLIPRPGLELQIPRFSHRSIINATVSLKKMGLKDLFNAHTADLRGLNGVAHELHLSDMLQINNFATCGENRIGDDHHSEIYPMTAAKSFRTSRNLDNFQSDDGVNFSGKDNFEEPRDYQRAFHDPLHDPRFLSLPLSSRPRQARLPDTPRLRFDRPFLYFVRHNPTGLILHMGRFNPRLLP